jgi:hypothetical protein
MTACMSRTFKVTAAWDPEAKVFYSQSDIPGLVVEAESFDEFLSVVQDLAPDIIAANIPDAKAPYTVHVETSRELIVAAA